MKCERTVSNHDLALRIYAGASRRRFSLSTRLDPWYTFPIRAPWLPHDHAAPATPRVASTSRVPAVYDVGEDASTRVYFCSDPRAYTTDINSLGHGLPPLKCFRPRRFSAYPNS